MKKIYFLFIALMFSSLLYAQDCLDDTEPPVLSCPENIVVENDPGEIGAVINIPIHLGNPFASGDVNVLLVYADFNTYAQDVQTKLLATGKVTSVDLRNASGTVPTLAELEGYDAVLVWRNGSFPDAEGLGNVLVDYINGGGGVVVGALATSTGSFPAGAFATDEFQVIIPGTRIWDTPATLGTVHLPDHPLMTDVTSFDGGIQSYRAGLTTLTTGSFPVADWNDGNPLIAAKENVGTSNVRRVDINLFPPSLDVDVNSWLPTTDGAQIMANALVWVSNPPPENAIIVDDNCSDVTLTNDFNDEASPSGFYPIGTTTVTVKATDEAGNSSTCTFTVTVEDNVDPVAVCKEAGTGSAAYVSSTAGEPWGSPTNQQAMDLVFGSGNWDQLYYETLDAGTLFSNDYDFIFMEGGDYNANIMETFVDANISAMETWVANGGNLLLNAAPNEGDGMNWGFWGVELVYNGGIYTSIAEATNPAHPIFAGPFTPVIPGPYSGDSYAHAILPEELNVTVLMHNADDPTQYVLSYAEWGSGLVFFGGMTTTNWHSPQPQATNLRANMLDFLSKAMLEFQLDNDGNVTITPADIDGGSFDNAGIASMEVNPSEFGIDDVGEKVVTLTVTDYAGNTSTCTTTILINGDHLMSPDVVANPLEVYLDTNGRYVLKQADLEEMAEGTTDNLTPFEELELSAYPRIFVCDNLGEIIHTRLTVEDADGNIARAWTTVTVHDTLPPAFVPVNDIEIVLEPGLAESSIDYPVLEVLDNCTLMPELIEGLGPDGIFPAGITTETWVVEDGGGNTDTLSFTVTIITTNDLPTIDPIEDITANEDDPPVMVELSGISYGNDIDEQTITVSAESDNTELVSAISVNYASGSTGSLEIELAPDLYGNALITITVEDSEGGIVTESFTLTVNSVNDTPFVVNPIADQVVNASYVLKVPVSSELGELFDDPDGDELTISAMLENGDPLPAWTEMMNDSLVFSPMIEDTGCVHIVVMATDPDGAAATDTFQLCVEGYPVNAGQITFTDFNVNMYPNPVFEICIFYFTQKSLINQNGTKADPRKNCKNAIIQTRRFIDKMRKNFTLWILILQFKHSALVLISKFSSDFYK